MARRPDHSRAAGCLDRRWKLPVVPSWAGSRGLRSGVVPGCPVAARPNTLAV